MAGLSRFTATPHWREGRAAVRSFGGPVSLEIFDSPGPFVDFVVQFVEEW